MTCTLLIASRALGGFFRLRAAERDDEPEQQAAHTHSMARAREREKDKLCVWLAVRSLLLLLAGASLSIWRAGWIFRRTSRQPAISHLSVRRQSTSDAPILTSGEREERKVAPLPQWRDSKPTRSAHTVRIQTLATSKNTDF